MKTALRCFSVFFTFTLFLYLPALGLQQDADILVKALPEVNTVNNGANNSSSSIKKPSNTVVEHDTSFNFIDTRYKAALVRLKQKASSVAAYVKAKDFNAEYIFMVDMSIPSGKKRFFVYNLKADSLECSSLVAHGFGSTIKESEDKLLFSNNNLSFKTSLGKYKVGASYKGSYGLAYKLYGLDTSNSKAYERAIVLHAESHVPVAETYPEKICQSAGCPMVAPSFLLTLGNYIKSSKKPILLWIYN